VLAQVVDAFPEGTVHLAVVDPGVGTDRRLIVVEARDQWFVLPDNGLIAGVLEGREASKTWEIRNPRLWRAVVSSTFHGRDILAPVAAHLLRGGDPADVGPRVDGPHPPRKSGPDESAGRLVGEVVFVDSFGNLITNLSRSSLGDDPGGWAVEILGRTIEGLVATYGNRPPGSLVALVGSSGLVEVALVNGDASKRLEATRGTPVVLRRLGGIGN
jgi:S-adenosyl-L-methionine hydrolase (adenosine-forming)